MRYLTILLVSVMTSLTLPAQQPIIIDRHAVALFEHIPDTFLQAAREMSMMFSDRSVGQNINEALNFMQAPSWAQTPASARRDYTDSLWNWKTFTAADLAAGVVPERILFDPDPIIYNRSNWIFEEKSGSWSELTADFILTLGPAYENQVKAWSYQFSYLNVTDTDDIADPQTGFFADTPGKYDIHDLEAYLAQHPDITFFFWTTSLARSIGNAVSTSFNEQMRQYCLDNNKILFDMADIISHTDQDQPCYDNRDGVPYIAMNGQSENHPDDGFDYPAICQDYTTETEGGHLGSVSAGKVRMAKAFWVLMARIAGWDGQIITSTKPLDEAGYHKDEAAQIPTIYPNPTSYNLYVNWPSASAFRSELMSVTGQLLRVQDNGVEAINLEDLPNGYYYLRVTATNGKRYVLPVVKTSGL
jgi:hypothetical protein